MSNPLFIGKVLHHFEKLPSTNEYAKELVSKSKPPEGTVISTYFQTHGRGQIGSKWESEPGRNLSLSVILYPKFLRITEQAILNQAISIACRSFLAEWTTKEVEVKWPNDLLINGKKIGGILIQTALSGNQILSAVVGIGINVNQRNFSQAPNPTSLSQLANKFFDLDVLQRALCSHIESAYLRLKAGNHKDIAEEYLSHLFKFEEKALYERVNRELFWGTIVGISSMGKLKVQTDQGEEEFGLKEIQFKS